jgi:hypothetical protein
VKPKNPFKPTFGAVPPILAGRDGLINEFADAIYDGPGAPGRATLYTGARGSGKTVLLNEVEDRARQQGWLIVSETADRGLLDRLTQTHLPRLLSKFDPDAIKRAIGGFGIPVVGGNVTWETLRPYTVKMDLRSQIDSLTDLLSEDETGLLITVDEIHKHQKDDLRAIAAAIQHAIREEREVAFVAAGLESSVGELLKGRVLTFLRRADKHHLGPVSEEDVREALLRPTEDSGKEIEPDALELMVAETRGYPFMIQLVGYHCWQRSGRNQNPITVENAKEGTLRASRRLGSLVHEPSLNDASTTDKSFLLAMSSDDGPSKMADIASRMNVTKEYAGVYRNRLIEAELIEAAGHGYVDFALPYLREYLRDHSASLASR